MHGSRAIISGLALASVAACASGPPGGGPPGGGPDGHTGGAALQEARIARPIAILFTGMDTNGDLVVDRTELEVAIPREFARADADGSSVLTGFEMADWCRLVLGDKEALPDMRAMDTDINYTITQIEFAGALRHEFERMDRSADGRITRAEMLMDAPRGMQRGEGGGQGAPGGGERGGRSGGGGGGRGPGSGGGGQPPF